LGAINQLINQSIPEKTKKKKEKKTFH